MYEAEHLIDERFSQSDEMNSSGAYMCGGHITISSLNHTSTELLRLMRPYIAIIYALNRKRLSNRFCCHNVNARTRSEPRTSQFNLGHSKYQPIFEKGKLLEFRLWSRFTSVKQMINRYKMMSIIVDYAVNDRGTYAKLINKLKPIILSMYSNNEQKVNELIELSRHFRRFLIKNRVNEFVLPFLTDLDISSHPLVLTPTARRLLRSREIRFANMR
tara:strand:- start:736 stop:1383 length:648 start_codon:yes stop_codon:yes gene_type:complete